MEWVCPPGNCLGHDSRRDSNSSRRAHKTAIISVKKPTTAKKNPTANKPSTKVLRCLRRRRLRRRRRACNATLRCQRRILMPTNTPPNKPMSNEPMAAAKRRGTASFCRGGSCLGGMLVFSPAPGPGDSPGSSGSSQRDLQPGLSTARRLTRYLARPWAETSGGTACNCCRSRAPTTLASSSQHPQRIRVGSSWRGRSTTTGEPSRGSIGDRHEGLTGCGSFGWRQSEGVAEQVGSASA